MKKSPFLTFTILLYITACQSGEVDKLRKTAIFTEQVQD